MPEAPDGVVNPEDAVEIIELDGSRVEPNWSEEKQAVVINCPRRRRVHVEMFAGGGGGGGSTRGGAGGGGGAGEYKFVALDLEPGRFCIDVGQGGPGGRSYGRNESPSDATAGGDSWLRHWDGLVQLHCKGGKAGATNGTGGARGADGEDVVSAQGVIVSHGGRGGDRDRPGRAPGERDWGAGGGGGGVFRGPSNYFSGNGANGRVRMVFVS